MNTFSASSIASLLCAEKCPARTAGATASVSTFLKCLAGRGLTGTGVNGIRRISERNLAIREASAITEMTSHLCNDIGLTQGQYLAAQVAPVLDLSAEVPDTQHTAHDPA